MTSLAIRTVTWFGPHQYIAHHSSIAANTPTQYRRLPCADTQSSPSATPAPTASRSIPRAISSSATPICSASSSSRDTASLSRVSFPHLTLERASPTVSSAAGSAIANACTLRRAPPGGSVMWTGTTRVRRPCGPVGRIRRSSRTGSSSYQEQLGHVAACRHGARSPGGIRSFPKVVGEGHKRPSSCLLTAATRCESLEAATESTVTEDKGLTSVDSVGHWLGPKLHFWHRDWWSHLALGYPPWRGYQTSRTDREVPESTNAASRAT